MEARGHDVGVNKGYAIPKRDGGLRAPLITY